MTVQRAIELLTQLKATHGDVEVFIDCPHCGKSLRPTLLVPTATLQADSTR